MEDPVERNPAKKTKGIITAAKYLIKMIKRFPKEEIDNENNKKLNVIYEQLLEVISNQIRLTE